MVLPKEVLDHFIITDIEYVDTKAYDESVQRRAVHYRRGSRFLLAFPVMHIVF